MDPATLDAAKWWAMPRGPETAAWIGNYKTSLLAPHRRAISAIVGAYAPATVLEIGSHCGPNLIRIATDHPGVQCAGIDPSVQAVQAGREWIRSLGLAGRIGLTEGAFPQATTNVPSKSVEVVLSCYVLAYLAPADLDHALFEIGRLATRAVILAEPTGRDTERHTLGGYREWHHDYQAALPWIATLRGTTQRIVSVDPAVDALSEIRVFTM